MFLKLYIGYGRVNVHFNSNSVILRGLQIKTLWALIGSFTCLLLFKSLPFKSVCFKSAFKMRIALVLICKYKAAIYKSIFNKDS